MCPTDREPTPFSEWVNVTPTKSVVKVGVFDGLIRKDRAIMRKTALLRQQYTCWTCVFTLESMVATKSVCGKIASRFRKQLEVR